MACSPISLLSPNRRKNSQGVPASELHLHVPLALGLSTGDQQKMWLTHLARSKSVAKSADDCATGGAPPNREVIRLCKYALVRLC